MRRRTVLASIAAAAAVPTGGCATVLRGSGSDGPDPPADGPTRSLGPLAERGFPPDLCEEPIDPGGILAIDEPAFGGPADWPAEPGRYGPLTDDEFVVGLVGDGTARAYPLAVLFYHEVVNDRLGGPVLVTYCSLCASGMVARRTVGADVRTFGVSGLLWRPPRVYTGASEAEGRVFATEETGLKNNGNLVLYDEATGSYWSQLLARGICGPERGSDLSIRPSTLATWGEWRASHPDSVVLLPPPTSGVLAPPGTGGSQEGGT